MHRDKEDSLKFEVSSLKARGSIPRASNFTPQTSHARRGGFTFVELLATLALISIVMPVLMQTFSLCTRVAGESRRQVEAVSLATTKLTEMMASQDWQTGAVRGDFGQDWPGYEWSMTVGNWVENSSLRQIDLTVTWQSAGRQRKTILSTLVYMQE